MMDNNMILSLILGVTVAIGGSLFFVFPILKKKGVNTEEILNKADAVLKGIEGAIDAAKVVLPGNKYVDILSQVEHWTQIGIDQAQQLYISSQIPAEQRKDKARDLISESLKILNITMTPELQVVVDGLIEAEVYASKTEGERNIQKDNVAQALVTKLKEENSNIQAKYDQSQLENTQLKQALSQVQSTVNTVSTPQEGNVTSCTNQ